MQNNTNDTRLSFRRRENPYSQISNTAIDDERLSRDARFLYVTIQRWLTAPNFIIYKSFLKKKVGIGSDNTFDKYWNELKKAGYLVQYKFKDDKGRWCYDYEILENPVIQPPADDNKNTDNTHTPKNEVWEKDENHTPVFEGVENRPGGKVGYIHKTNGRKTNKRNTDKSSSLKNEKEEEVIKVESIISYAKENEIVLTEKQIYKLVKAYDFNKILQAIASTGRKENIDNPYSYIIAVLNNNSIPRQTVITNIKENKLKSHNFDGRGADYYERMGEAVREASTL